jgi:hypothetical protein
LIAWIVAIALGIAVVVLGLRRNLGDTTRKWLPRSEEASVQEIEALWPSDDEQRRRPLSPRQRRWMIWAYLLMSLSFAAFAVLSAHNWLFNAIFAVTLALNAAVLWRK